MTASFSRFRVWPVLFFGVLLLGVGVRLKPLFDDVAFQEASYQGAPLVTCYDGYFYLRLARDLTVGRYDAVDEKRSPTAGSWRPIPPPLLSVITASVVDLMRLPLRWVAAIIPPVFSVLLAIPVFAIGRRTGGLAVGLVAAAASVLAPYYIYRSSLGWFDTDCLNVVWPYCLAYALIEFGLRRTWGRYAWGAMAALFFLLYRLWWHTAAGPVDVICVALGGTCLVFLYRAGRREAACFLGVLGIAIMVLWGAAGWAVPVEKLRSVVSMFWFKLESVGAGRAVNMSVSENASPAFGKVVAAASGGLVPFVMATVGLVIMFARCRRIALFLTPLIVLGMMGFVAYRFMIFLAPVAALGVGHFAGAVWRIRWRRPVLGWCAVVAVLGLIAVPLLASSMRAVVHPKVPADVVDGMAKIQRLTEGNAVVFGWWDTAYTLQYWADRTTVVDGGGFGEQEACMLARPFVMTNARGAANWIRSYAVRGNKGLEAVSSITTSRQSAVTLLEELMSAGPVAARRVLARHLPDGAGNEAKLVAWLDSLFPTSGPPVYVFLDRVFAEKVHAWHRFGTWDDEQGSGRAPRYRVLFGCSESPAGIASGGELVLDCGSGIVRMVDGLVPVRRLVRYKDGIGRTSVFHQRSEYHFEYVHSAGLGVVTDSAMAESMFNKLYVRRQGGRCFVLVCELAPCYQVWRVLPDDGLVDLPTLP